MLRLAVFLVMIASAFGQEVPTRVSPDDAAKHLVKSPAPEYPTLAEQARIAGNVILDIRIDENGSVSGHRLISGHPMLVPAAIKAINRWQYQPFEFDGKPVPVVTFAIVSFGNYGLAESRAEMLLQDGFWRAAESAKSLLAKGDYAAAEGQLNKAGDLVPPESADLRHVPERWQWMTIMGRLRMEQQKYDEAEQYYNKALALRENKALDQDAPEMAASLASLGNLFAEEKRPEAARDHLLRSVEIYRRNFKKVGSGNRGARQAFGQAIAHESYTLLKLAEASNDAGAAKKQCRTILDFQEFLARWIGRRSSEPASKKLCPLRNPDGGAQQGRNESRNSRFRPSG